MKVIQGLNNLNKIPRGTFCTIGIFDGIHRGHREIFTKLINQAKRKRTPSLVITFNPHPSELPGSSQGFHLLTSLRYRLLLLERLGIDYCLIIPFDKKFSHTSAYLFVKDILYKGLGIKILYLGENFRFGNRQKGDIELLKKLSNKFGFRLVIIHLLRYRNRIISSSWIRDALQVGNLNLVSRLLGRPFSIYGKVIKGEGRGNSLGFPTANLDIEDEAIPPSGVYLVNSYFNKDVYHGLLYIGCRPTVAKKDFLSVELYLLNFRGNLYGKFLEVEFIRRIRREKKFDSISSLISAIKQDTLSARNFFRILHN